MTEIEAPNFEEMMEMVETIHTIAVERQHLEVEIDVMEAEVIKKATMDKDLSPDGKPLSATFVINTYKITGINGELTPLRYRLAHLIAESEKAQKMFEVMKMKFETWRTEQANIRKSAF